MKVYDQDNKAMKIVTINLPQKYIEAIKKICKIQRILAYKGYEVPKDIDFPSRSEFVRVAVREALFKYLDFHRDLEQFSNEPMEITLNKLKHFNGSQDKKILIPSRIENNIVKEFKTYKIIKRLEF